MPYKVYLVQNKVYFPFALGHFTTCDVTVGLLITQMVKEKVAKSHKNVNWGKWPSQRQFDFLYHNWSSKSDRPLWLHELIKLADTKSVRLLLNVIYTVVSGRNFFLKFKIPGHFVFGIWYGIRTFYLFFGLQCML